MQELAAKISAAAEFISHQWNRRPRVGIVLGTGLGDFADQLDIDQCIPYLNIPHFPQSTAVGHKGQLVCGRFGGASVIAMQGRFHLYEGYSLQSITLPIRVMGHLGIELLLVSNASGGLNPAYRSGDVMIIDDHINLMGTHPLVGVHNDRLVPRFPDMSCAYDPRLIQQALAAARHHDVPCHRGVYAAMTGPNFETRAEYRFLRRIGADVVGMSTVPEVIVAAQAGLRVLGLSAVTNLCRPDALKSTDAHFVEAAAEHAAPTMSHIAKAVIDSLVH